MDIQNYDNNGVIEGSTNEAFTKTIAYIINDQMHLGPYNKEPFEIKQSANAWWMDRGKVYAFLMALRMGASVKLACSFAMISIDQYKYFCKTHPQFYLIKERLEVEPEIKALFYINKTFEDEKTRCKTKLKIAKWMLATSHPAIWGSSAERLFWAKQALNGRVVDENIIEQLKTNLEDAREN